MKSLVIAPTLHSSNWRVFAETLAFIILGGFHRWYLGEIHQISRVKSPTLHSSNWRVFAETLAFIILGGFHRWNLGEIRWISQVKSARFHGWNQGWNPPDFERPIARNGKPYVLFCDWSLASEYQLLVSVGHIYDLQVLFSEIDNLHTVNCIELQLWHVSSHGDGCLQTWKKTSQTRVISDWPYILSCVVKQRILQVGYRILYLYPCTAANTAADI